MAKARVITSYCPNCSETWITIVYEEGKNTEVEVAAAWLAYCNHRADHVIEKFKAEMKAKGYF